VSRRRPCVARSSRHGRARRRRTATSAFRHSVPMRLDASSMCARRAHRSRRGAASHARAISPNARDARARRRTCALARRRALRIRDLVWCTKTSYVPMARTADARRPGAVRCTASRRARRRNTRRPSCADSARGGRCTARQRCVVCGSVGHHQRSGDIRHPKPTAPVKPRASTQCVRERDARGECPHEYQHADKPGGRRLVRGRHPTNASLPRVTAASLPIASTSNDVSSPAMSPRADSSAACSRA
jgi:hypothetical protein